MSEAFTPAEQANLHTVLTFLAAGYLPRLRAMSRAEVRAIAETCAALSLAEPLHLMSGERYHVAGWESLAKLTGRQVIALLACGVWLLAGDSEANGFSMLVAFPWMKDALVLAQEKAGTL